MTSTAIMFCTTLLKEVWVTSYLTWWVAGALIVIRSSRKLAWLAFGFYCGVGVGLRSNLLLLGGIAQVMLVFRGRLNRTGPPARVPGTEAGMAALIVCGVALALAPWSLRNHQANGTFSPLPNNGGIVLHQLYNPENPESAIWIPAFVNYLDPGEIWRGYAAEADRRAGRSLSPPQVDRYWRGEAQSFLLQHPGQVLEDMLRKTVKYLCATEIPINRSLAEESQFSPVLKWLPAPAALLLALGLAGLVWLALADRRWPIVAVPILVSWATVTLFFAEDRFRFHAASMLAFCSGVWIDGIVQQARGPGRRQGLMFAGLAALIGTVSIYLGSRNPAPPIRWDHIVWGYVKMGKLQEARTLALRIAREQPDNGSIQEALGYTAIQSQQYSEAARDLQRAIELRPRSHVAHYNLARVFLALGDHRRAAEEARIAVGLDPSPEYQALLHQIESSP
jgi:tetratricopeptide (TPR) repeat protein